MLGLSPHPERFLNWVGEVEILGVAIHNPVPVLRWNHDKRYLQELRSDGIPVPQTVWLEVGSKANLADILAEHGWSKAVVKPTVSATAWQTSVVRAETAGQNQLAFEGLLNKSGMMVQEFIKEIGESGEWSLIFFGGHFSHAVLKRPLPGDFRVQRQFGGNLTLAAPPATILEQAAAILSRIKGMLLYARIDGVMIGNEFYLMELELIEPELFLLLTPNAANDFAAAIARTIGSTSE